MLAGIDDCPILAEMLRGNVDSVSTRNNLEVLFSLMSEYKPQRTLECGFGEGGSALAFCTSHHWLGHAAENQHVAIDPFQNSRTKGNGLRAIERAGLSKFLDFRETYSALALPALLSAGTRFGLIYVDGSHTYEDVFVDAYFGVRLLEADGLITFDDCSDPQVREVIKYLRTKDGLRELDINRRRRHPLVYRVARRLGKIQMTAFQAVK